jgi:LPXTG-site transpeptidase (sortase) family protein
MKKRKENKIIILIGLLLITSSIMFFVYDIYKNTKKEVQEVKMVENFFEEEPQEEVKEEVKEEETNNSSSPSYNYIAILEIPSINLKRGIVDFNSKYNSVKYNIQIIEHSQMPDVENSNLILAGHNGTSSVSFFKDLYKLKEDSLIYLYYDGYKYIYKLNNYYDTDKDGKVEIIRNRYKTTITLITCKKGIKDKQTVFIGYLVDKVDF